MISCEKAQGIVSDHFADVGNLIVGRMAAVQMVEFALKIRNILQ